MPNPFIGQISMFGGNFAPRGWALCNGQLLSIAQNTALFSILGTTYGGDGRTTFALPDMRGRAGINSGNSTGPGLSPRPLGQRLGQEYVVLNNLTIPSHSHTITNGVANVTAQAVINVGKEGKGVTAEDTSTNNFIGNHSGAFRSSKGTAALNTNAGSFQFDVHGATNFDGGGNEHNNMMPYLVVNYIIALVGTYPSRN